MEYEPMMNVRSSAVALLAVFVLGAATPTIAFACEGGGEEGGGGVNEVRLSPPTYRFKKAESHNFVAENFSNSVATVKSASMAAESPVMFELEDPNKCTTNGIPAFNETAKTPGTCTYVIKVKNWVTGKLNHFTLFTSVQTPIATVETGP